MKACDKEDDDLQLQGKLHVITQSYCKSEAATEGASLRPATLLKRESNTGVFL